jgi:hypothetical protein
MELSNNNNLEADMKRGAYCGLLIAEAMVCIAFTIAQASFSGMVFTAMAFPFEQIGSCLRALSLSGGSGNTAAVAIYAILCLSPVSVLMILGKRRKLFAEDGLLGVLSAALFVDLYFMVNPALAGGVSEQAVAGAALACAIYSIICGYFVLRALRLFFQSDAEKLIRYMKLMLGVLGALFTYLAFGVCFGGMLDSISVLRADNTVNENLPGASYAFLVMRFTIDALPYIFDTTVILAALRLSDEIQMDRYSTGTVAAAERMSRICITALTVTIMTNIGFNVLQLLFMRTIRTVNMSVDIPVISTAFVLAALLLTRFIAENKKLKDDNDMFI